MTPFLLLLFIFRSPLLVFFPSILVVISRKYGLWLAYITMLDPEILSLLFKSMFLKQWIDPSSGRCCLFETLTGTRPKLRNGEKFSRKLHLSSFFCSLVLLYIYSLFLQQALVVSFLTEETLTPLRTSKWPSHPREGKCEWECLWSQSCVFWLRHNLVFR